MERTAADNPTRPRIGRRLVAIGGLALLFGTSGCTILPLYANHGYPFCHLQLGPDLPENRAEGDFVRFPIFGDSLWEACHGYDGF